MTRWRTEVPIWQPWKHISRLSGELTLGRVCFDFYFGQYQKWARPKTKVLQTDDRKFHRSFALMGGPALLIVRRWK